MAILNLSRREFLQTTGIVGTGLMLGWRTPSADMYEEVEVNPVVHIGTDGRVTFFVERAEMGQGIHSGLAQLAAEELEADWNTVHVKNRVLSGSGKGVTTGGSSSVRREWEPMQQAGAAAREMLVQAAAERWKVPAGECRANNGEVVHRLSGQKLGYGKLAVRAAQLPVPETVELKSPDQWKLIGRPVKRPDIPAKVDGSARFGIDVRVDGMLYAAPAMSPVIGGELESFDRPAAMAVSGVREVVKIPKGMAVIADHYWQARKGLQALNPRFGGGDSEFSSSEYSAQMGESLKTPGVLVFEQGDVQKSFEGAQVVEARYEVPYLAQACMEPMNCTASVTPEGCEVWAPTQASGRLRSAVSEAVSIPEHNITVHMTYLGGGFGRRAEPDFAVQAAVASQAVGRPVKLIWSREDDTQQSYYRPACASELRAAVDSKGDPLAIYQHVVGPWQQRHFPAWMRQAIGDTEKELGGPLVPGFVPQAISSRLPRLLTQGVAGLVAGRRGPPTGYDIPNQRKEYSLVNSEVPIGWWRAVAASQLAFFTESFIDELAVRSGKDPYAYRRKMASAKERKVMDRAAALSGWDRPLPKGKGRGMALYTSSGTTLCQVAEVEVANNSVSVEQVYCAVDCGQVLNPNSVKAQMESGIIFGLTAALRGEITLTDGQVQQSNFHDYQLVGFSETPEIEVEIIKGTSNPKGIGEPGTPPIAPAVANAIYAATGQRIRTLPIEKALKETSSG